MTLALYRKWRPKAWEEVIGQPHVIETLHNALKAGRYTHAYLFAGPRGTGKTSTARLVAYTVNCENTDTTLRPCGECNNCKAFKQGGFMDLIEIDAASNTSVEDVRDLRDKINFSPNQGDYKVYIIDEVHMLSTAAFNALLKTLEEPPPHAIFVLATTEPHKIPATVLSRCQRHEFRRIPILEIKSQLEVIVDKEGIQADEDALDLIARQATGSMRDAISLLDQLASTGDKITLERSQDVLGTATNLAVIDLIEALIDKKAAAGLELIHVTLDSGSDARQFARQIVDYLRTLLLINMGDKAQIDELEEVKAAMTRHAKKLDDRNELLRIMRLFNQAAFEIRSTWHPSMPLEMAFIESMESPSVQVAPIPEPSVPSITEPAPRPIVKSEKKPPIPEVALSEQDKKSTQDLNTVWKQVMEQVRGNNPKARGLLNSTKACYIKGNQVVLCFASEIVKSKMEKEDNIESVQVVLQQLLQREVTIRCEVDTTQLNTIPPEVDQDGIVAAALRDLGGEIVDVQ